MFKLSPPIDDEIASILDPFGNATHTALAFNVVGEDVLITGAGPIGIMAVAIARHCGARHVVITDVNDYRLDLARPRWAPRKRHQRARESLDDAMSELGMEEGFDVGFEMSGNAAALREMLRTMHHGGSISMLGIPPGETAIDWNQVIFKGLVIKGIYGREMFETWYKMASMLQSGLNVRPVITHRFGVQRLPRRVRDHEFGQVRQGHPGLVGALRRAAPRNCTKVAGNTQARFVKLAAVAPSQEPAHARHSSSRVLTPICFKKKAFANLATLMPDGKPQVTPVWVEFDGHHVVINTAEGRQKDKNLQRDKRVALSIMDPDNPYRYLEVRGKVVERTHNGADANIDALAKKYLGKDKYPFRQPNEVRVIYKIEPQHVTTMG